MYDDESPAADVLEAVLPGAATLVGGRLLLLCTTPELPVLESESAENNSSSPKGSEGLAEAIDELRRRLKTPDIARGGSRLFAQTSSELCCGFFSGKLVSGVTVVAGESSISSGDHAYI